VHLLYDTEWLYVVVVVVIVIVIVIIIIIIIIIVIIDFKNGLFRLKEKSFCSIHIFIDLPAFLADYNSFWDMAFLEIP
jgi:hypothetical protein